MKVVYLLILVLSASAATLFSVTPDYTVTFAQAHDELAHAYYDQKLNEHGMNYLYLYANGMKSLIDQHRGAGFL